MDEAIAAPSHRPHAILRGTGILILAVIAFWAVRNIDGRTLLVAMRQSDWRLLLLAMAANMLTMALQAWRWRILLSALAPSTYLDAASAPHPAPAGRGRETAATPRDSTLARPTHRPTPTRAPRRCTQPPARR